MAERNGNEPRGALQGVLVRDLMPWHQLRALCRSCGRDRPVPAQAIERKIGTLSFVLDAERFLRCSGCGNRKGNALYVVKLGRD